MPHRPNGLMVRRSLGEIAEIRGGYIAPASSPSGVEGTVRGLQASDVGPDGSIAWPAVRAVSAPRDPGRYELREGDVLLPLRSMRMAATVARHVPTGVIAVGSWAMLTPRAEQAVPDFLAWYLNHPTTARRLGKLSQGSSLQFLSLGAIRDFEVELPSIEVQHRIARAHQLESRVSELEQQLAYARKQLVDAITMAALHLGHGRAKPNGGASNEDQTRD